VTALILLDFSAAFDCVDHCILLKVLQDSFGISGTILNWFLSYLSNRTQYVRINLLISSIASVFFGVPQGSVLGPLLFILYTSALSAIASRHGIEIHLYADDTQLYVHLRLNEVANATKRLRACIDDIMLWSLSMRLKLNPSKSELIWFDRSSKLLQCTELSLSTSSSLLSPASTVRDLGVILDSALSLKPQIAAISRACLFHLRRIRQLRSTLDSASLKTLIHCLILTRLDYCNSVLYGLPECTLLPLTRILHQAARLCLGLSYRDHITPALRSLHWLPVCERIRFKLALLMYRACTDHLPSYLSSMVTPCNSVKGRSSLRSASDGKYVVPGTRLVFGRRSFTVAGPSIWNSLPPHVRNSLSETVFRSKLKTYLFQSI